MQRLLVLVELLDELLDPVLVIKPFGFGSVWRSSVKMISKPEFKEGQFAQPLRDLVRLEFHRLAEDFRVRLERDQRAGALGFADDFEFLGRLAALELHVMDFAVARDLHLNHSLTALTHLAPTPCVPPENL
jgi:hypothetical protein